METIKLHMHSKLQRKKEKRKETCNKIVRVRIILGIVCVHCLTYYYIRARTIQLNKFSLIPTRLETEGASRQLHYMVG